VDPKFFNPRFEARIGLRGVETQNLHSAIIARIEIGRNLGAARDQRAASNPAEDGRRTMPPGGRGESNTPSQKARYAKRPKGDPERFAGAT
jgi:hypothetical protein